MKLILIGFGVVGQGLARILHDKAADLRAEQGFEGQIVAVITRSRGTLYHPDGLNSAQLLSAIDSGNLSHYPQADGLQRDGDALTLIRECNADVLVEASPTNLESGQPALDYCLAAFASGKHVVLANKGPLAVAYDELAARAREAGKRLLFEGTVMAGTPALRLGMEALAGCSIGEVRGILNGTTNYILTQMETGMDYAQALSQAQELGYAESDPTADVEGWDVAAKVSILSLALFGKALPVSKIAVQGITQITAGDIAEARAAGERWKLIATLTPGGGSVQPRKLPLSDPLAGVSGVANALTYHTDFLGAVTLAGPGAGQLATGFALLADLLAI